MLIHFDAASIPATVDALERAIEIMNDTYNGAHPSDPGAQRLINNIVELQLIHTGLTIAHRQQELRFPAYDMTTTEKLI